MRNEGRRAEPGPAIALLYLLFFLSGAAALVYQVAWVRSLGLVFGGSHLAVATTLSVFMGGLALGGWLLGRRADASARPLRLYAVLEIGIALSAAMFALLLQLYPVIYAPLARLAETNPVWLTALRVGLAAGGMIVPTTLMGGTLPVLSRFVAARPERLGRHLASLYALNTLGAVAGTIAAGFYLLRTVGVTRTVGLAVATNLAIGVVAWLLPERLLGRGGATREVQTHRPADVGDARRAFDLVLLGIGISGFCALGYEVLWTRMLTLVLGTSVYGFTIILAAFLTGIAVGGRAEPILFRVLPDGWRSRVAMFGAVQVLIGLSAAGVTYALRDLPAYAVGLQTVFRTETTPFVAHQVASFVVAFAFMATPAFFMGLAFPLAGTVNGLRRGAVGAAIGEVLTFNTVGAILGAAFSGFVLIYWLGIERSLQFLAAINLGLGVAVLASLAPARGRRVLLPAAVAAGVILLVALAADPDWGRAWDSKFFAVFRNNQYEAFDAPDRIRDALENTDVLYYFEGANETISVIRPRGAQQAFIVNGRVEASTSAQDRQCQRTLGHLPMLAHPNPRKVFVLGTGTGMTLGATTLHPEAEEIVLAEIEPGVLPATRTFAAWNHRALDNPKVRVVFNDGRNFLQTTRERFDVITADPIHPWSGGASYLYTTEYFAVAASRLEPGGVICQWLPIYELESADLKSVVRSFSANFRYSMLWLTHYDAELLGSNSPIVFDLEVLERRISRSPVREDLADVEMGSAADFLGYYLAGTSGLAEFARDGVLNTDDNLWLEFHSPKSRGIARRKGDNVMALSEHRDDVRSVLAPAADPALEQSRRRAWDERFEAARLYDRAHASFLGGQSGSPEFARILRELRARHPDFAPGRFLAREDAARAASEPRLLDSVRLRVLGDGGIPTIVEVSAVAITIGPGRGVVMFVDNAAREVYAERYIDADPRELDRELAALAANVLGVMRREFAAAGNAAARPTPASLRSRLNELLEASSKPPA